jgi:hypothetical protein
MRFRQAVGCFVEAFLMVLFYLVVVLVVGALVVLLKSS